MPWPDQRSLTSESYTTARAHLLQKHQVLPTEYARLAGVSDATLRARTGCAWERWVRALDRAQPYSWPHRRIAAYVRQTYKVADWWCQTVTVGYERIKGLRVVGQRRDGGFEASKSKTFTAPLTRLYRAWSDARTRAT